MLRMQQKGVLQERVSKTEDQQNEADQKEGPQSDVGRLLLGRIGGRRSEAPEPPRADGL